MNPILKHNLEAVRKLCEKYHVSKMYAFGSISSESFNDESDLDFLVSFRPMDYGDYTDNYFMLAKELEQLFQRDVDLVTENSLSNPYFIKMVERTKLPVYA